MYCHHKKIQVFDFTVENEAEASRAALESLRHAIEDMTAVLIGIALRGAPCR